MRLYGIWPVRTRTGDQKVRRRFLFFGAISVALIVSARAQTSTVREESNIHGRPGWVLENGKIRVGLLRGGGHIAEVRLVSGNPRLSISPML